MASPLIDLGFLQHALRVAQRHMGRTWPNPSVGCVLVGDGQVLAAAATAETGRPHAETEALKIAGERARGATAYVTLEPCAHHGQTPPCAEALIAAGVARVVIAAIDRDPRVAGKGVAMLRAAGVDVTEQILPEAERLYRGFFRRVHHGMPEVSLKLATSLDGRMADHTGASQWITGAEARAHGHGLRASADAVLTGIGTVLADDPSFTARLPGLQHERLARVVADRHLRLPLESQLVRTASIQPTWIITTAEGIERAASHATDLREHGVKIIALDGELSPLTMLQALGREGITRLLVEAGPALSTSFLAAQMVDTLYWYRGPLLLGNAGKPAIAALDSTLKDAARGRSLATLQLGADCCEILELPSCLPV